MRCVQLALIFAVLAIGGSLRADTIEPIGAQGPAMHASERPRSAYHEPLHSAKPDGVAPPRDEVRRLDLSGSSKVRPSRTRPAAKRGTEMFSDWVRTSGATALAALAFVVGLFMLLAWALKRGMPVSAQVLPAEAVRVLGRVPLGSRQFGHLLHIGNKVVLVSVSQAGVEKLAEVDDPQEVLRLVALCGKSSKHGSQKEFEEIFGQFANERSATGFLGSEASLFSDSLGKGSSGGHRHA